MAGANGRLRSLFVGAQAAGSLVLLVPASLLLRAMVEAARVEPGIDADKLASVSPLLAAAATPALPRRATGGRHSKASPRFPVSKVLPC